MDYLPLSEILELKAWPTAALFPMLIDEANPPVAYEGMTMPQFADQILREGIREPLVIWNNFLIDGRNRREAARQAAAVKPNTLATLSFEPADLSRIPVRYVDFKDEEEADNYVLALNLDRRTMNKDQLACLAVQFWDLEAERAKLRQGTRTTNGPSIELDRERTRDALARRFHVSKNYIQKARSLYLNDRDKFDKALSGTERVISKLVNPQKVNPSDPDSPHVEAQKLITDGLSKFSAGIKKLSDDGRTEEELEGLQQALKEIRAEKAVIFKAGDPKRNDPRTTTEEINSYWNEVA